MKELYPMIFKRKSFRRFNPMLKLSEQELEKIVNRLEWLVPLADGGKLQYRLVKKEETSCKRGEYCLLFYGADDVGTLLNLGYMVEQLDLWLASQNIGACWYGMGKVQQAEQEHNGLPFLTMVAIGKAEPEEFRKDYTKAKRRETELIWHGEALPAVAQAVKYAPSACNLQPWLVKLEKNVLQVCRRQVTGSIIPKHKLAFYNSIDMGVFLCFLEITLMEKGFAFTRTMQQDAIAEQNQEKIKIACYKIAENK